MLLLFDIDGTLLLRAAGAHRDAIEEALRVVHGVADLDDAGMQVAGRTDRDIARGLLLRAGVSARRIDERADDVQIAACAAYARLCPSDLSATVAPGMGELLRRLADCEDTVLSLVTGNYEPIAHLKLGAARSRAASSDPRGRSRSRPGRAGSGGRSRRRRASCGRSPRSCR